MTPARQARRRALRLWLRLTTLVLWTCVALLIVGTVLYARQARQIRADYARNTELGTDRRHLQAILVMLVDAETGQRGYLLTGKSRYLAPYRQATAEIPALLDSLAALGLQDPEVAARVRALHAATAQKLDELARTIALYDRGDRAGALALVQSDAGQDDMEQARGRIRDLTDRIDQVRTRLVGALGLATLHSERLAIATVAALVASIGLAAFQIVLLSAERNRYERQLGVSERQHRAIVEEQTELISLARADGTLTYVNPAYAHHFELRTEDLIGENLYDFVLPDQVDAVRAQIDSVIRTGERRSGENLMLSPSGIRRWVAWTNQLQHDESGQPILHSVGRDITEHKRAQDALRESEAFLERQTATLNTILEAIPDAMAVWDSRLRYRMVNRAFERWRKLERSAVIGKTVEEVFGAFEYQRSRPWFERALAGDTVSYEKDYPDSPEHKHVSVTYVPLRLADGSIGGVIGMVHDITTHREERKRLISLSERDPLTGLLNRAGFEVFLQHQVAQDQGASLALLYIDLDRFKPVNDAHGHAAGDEVLRVFATRLQALVRPTDAVARLGGDEFAVVLAEVRGLADAERVADKIVASAREPITLVTGGRVWIGASVGVAHGVDRQQGWRELLARADAAVYRAKAAGRGQRG